MFNCILKHSNGELIELANFQKNVLLIVNVASLCEHTHQYEQLTTLSNIFKDRPFNILAFPCNQFANQEPSSITDILNICNTKFNINFPLFDKVDVNGENAHPLYKFLTNNTPCTFKTNSVMWNFTKFLVAKDLRPVKRYNPNEMPMNLIADIMELFEQN
jgi:glutathione peroxidase